MAAAMAAIEVSSLLTEARAAQREWGGTRVRDRLSVVRAFRHTLAESARDLLDLFPGHLRRSRLDSLTAEVTPLAEACRFLELQAERILTARKLSNRGRPCLFGRVDIELHREPLGVVLVVGPSNYPLFLPGVQSMQAITAGNAVLWKPGAGGSDVAHAFATLAGAAGLPQGLLQVLEEPAGFATAAMDAGVDKIVLTGSVDSGRAVLRAAAERMTPAIAELSGSDAAIVHSSCDLARAAKAIAFALRFNGGNTCIAPRRIFVQQNALLEFQRVLSAHCDSIPDIQPFIEEGEAIELANASLYGLGATVFAEESVAERIATRLNAGVVVVNDSLVPTADPRTPFGGRGLSGFGTTRGEEGLLQMTNPKAVAIQRAKRLRHLEELPFEAEGLLLHHLHARHGRTWERRVRAFSAFVRAAVRNGAKKS